MIENKLDKCPYCGGSEFAVGYQAGDGCIYVGGTYSGISGLRGSKIIHLFCMKCGTIIKSKVEKPEIFAAEENEDHL